MNRTGLLGQHSFTRARAARSKAALFWGLLLLLPAGCFSLKEPACAFSCQRPPNRCPDSYACASDGLCHRVGSTGICGLTPPDAGAPDGPDAPDRDDANDANDASETGP